MMYTMGRHLGWGGEESPSSAQVLSPDSSVCGNAGRSRLNGSGITNSTLYSFVSFSYNLNSSATHSLSVIFMPNP